MKRLKHNTFVFAVEQGGQQESDKTTFLGQFGNVHRASTPIIGRVHEGVTSIQYYSL